MRHPLDTYRKYPAFCQTVAIEAKTRLDTTHAMGLILTIISVLVGRPAIFASVALLAGAGAVVYYGSIGAVIAANPYLGAGLLATFGIGLGKFITTIYRQKEVLQRFKDSIVDRYEGDFLAAPDKPDADSLQITESRAKFIEHLVERAVVDFLNSLVALGHVSSSELSHALAQGNLLPR